MSDGAYEVFVGGDGRCPVLLTCEHASNWLPPRWAWPAADEWIVGTHWAYDIGIAEITRGLARRIGATAVLAKFSRLLADPNRDLDEETLCRPVANGRLVWLNQGITDEDRALRLVWWQAYHDAIDRLTAEVAGTTILSMHSFTPVYEGGAPRPMELGVLFDRDEAFALALADALARTGFLTARNEPYSGKGGLMYCVERHARRVNRVALELEVRQDLAGDPARVPGIVDAIATALAEIGAISDP